MADDFSDELPFGLADLPPGPLGEMTEHFSPAELAAARQRRAVLRGRDAPDNHTSPATLASTAAGFVPGSGFADIIGYLPDFKGGYEPSLVENLRRGNYGEAAGQGLSALGDVGYIANPLLAIALKSAREAQLAGRAAAGMRAQADLPRFMPPRGVPRHITDLVQNQSMREQLMEKMKIGMKMGGADWYNTNELRQAFMKELGDERGHEAFHKFLNYVVASSPMSDVARNLKMASHYYNLDMTGKQIGGRNPKGYGHFIAHEHQRYAQKIANEGLDPIQYPKLTSFSENLAGNHVPVTIDLHALRLPAMLARDANFLKPKFREALKRGDVSIEDAIANPAWWRRPNPNEYAALEGMYKEAAEKLGIAPAQAQSAAWVGGSELTGVRSGNLSSFMQHFWDRVERTAVDNKISREEALRNFIRGNQRLSLHQDMPVAVA